MASMARNRRGNDCAIQPHGTVIFRPHHGYTRYREPLFIIHASDRFVIVRSSFGDERIRRLDEIKEPRPSERALYSCIDPDELCLYGDPLKWTIRTWNGRVSSMTYGDVKIYPLCAAWDESVTDFFTLLDDEGVAASSLNTMSLNLWRSTLDKTVSFHEECSYDEMLGPLAMGTGGRKEARRGVYRRRVEYDISAAYPHALGMGMPSALTPVPEAFIKSMDISKWEGLCTARVRIPPAEWGPLPVVLDTESQLTCYGYTRSDSWTTVCLPLSELRTAMEWANCDIEIMRLHLATDRQSPFASWASGMVPRLRALRAVSGVVGKLVANRLWSCFAVSPYGVRREHTFDAQGIMSSRTIEADPLGQTLRRAATCYVGAFAMSRVRQRLYVEGLRRFSGVVYVDTDGIIAKPTDDVPAGWRAKTVMPYVDVAGPQAVYYTCTECLPGHAGGHEKGHWTVAGAESVEAKSRLFRIMKEGGILMANIGNVLPAMDVNEYAKETTEQAAYTTQPLFHHSTA